MTPAKTVRPMAVVLGLEVVVAFSVCLAEVTVLLEVGARTGPILAQSASDTSFDWYETGIHHPRWISRYR